MAGDRTSGAWGDQEVKVWASRRDWSFGIQIEDSNVARFLDLSTSVDVFS
jgi:hypothetical protein